MKSVAGKSNGKGPGIVTYVLSSVDSVIRAGSTRLDRIFASTLFVVMTTKREAAVERTSADSCMTTDQRVWMMRS